MFRRMFFVGAGGLTLLWALANPDLATAQKGPGKSFPEGGRPGNMQNIPRFTPPKPFPATTGPLKKNMDQTEHERVVVR